MMVSTAAKSPIPVFSASIQKGGTGKTTLNFTFAEYCALVQGKRVLIIDLDPQCNMSNTYIQMELSQNGYFIPPVHPEYDPNDEFYVSKFNPRSSIADIFEYKHVLPYASYITPDESTGFTGMIDVILGDQVRLTELQNEFTGGSDASEPKAVSPRTSYVDFAFRLSDFLRSDDISDAYDLVILDNGPTDNFFFRAVIYSASHILCPYTLDEYALNGISTLLNIAKDPKRLTRGFNTLNFVGIIPSKVNGNDSGAVELLERNAKSYGNIHTPPDIYMKMTSVLTARKLNVESSKHRDHSIFRDTKSAAVRRHFEHVMGYIYNQVFKESAQ
jgi:chromosome partitioning protein